MKSLLEKLYFVLIFGELTTAIPRVVGGGDAGNAATAGKSNPMLLLFNVLVVGSTLYFVIPKLPGLWRALLQLRWVFALYLWATATILWSVDRAISVRLGLYSFVYLLSAIYIAHRFNVDRLLSLLGRCFVGVGLLSIVGEIYLPSVDDLAPGWTGIFQQKNALGLCMMLGIAVLLVEAKRWTPRRIATCLFYCVMLQLSQSFTSVLSAAAVALFLFSRSMSMWKKAVFWILLAGAAVVSMVVSNPLDLLLNAGGKNSNLTGRDVIWAFALKGAMQNPLFGNGSGGAYWQFSSGPAVQALHWNPHHAHNGYIEILLDLGLVGVVLTLGLLANIWRRARRLRSMDRLAGGRTRSGPRCWSWRC